MMKNILVADRLAQECWSFLTQQSLFSVKRSANPGLLTENLSDIHGLLIRSKTQINEALLLRAPNLQVIVSCTSGFDHIDLESTAKWGITVMHVPRAHIQSVVQLTWSLILACASKTFLADKNLRRGDWNREALTGFELSGRTLGIVGLGRIGSQVASVGHSFGMRVLAYDPYQEDSVFEELNIARSSFEEVLKISDVLSFHVPKTPETQGMLGRSQFEYLQRGLILINTSRGSVIVERDLVEALNQGWVMSAGLDVFEKEPLPAQSPLLQLPQVILTPHIGANTDEAFYKASQEGTEKILRFFTDGSTSDTLPPKASWYGAAPFSKKNA